MSAAQPPIRLDPPGAGIPFFERIGAKYFLLPRLYKKMNWEKAQTVFDDQSAETVKITCDLTTEQWVRPVLIERLAGLEDSSRFWSVAMTLEHMMIVGQQMGFVISELAQGRRPQVRADTARVKPKGEHDPSKIREEFISFAQDFREKMTQVENRTSTLTFSHPWFGPMTAHQWHCLSGVHQRLHRQQIQAILIGMLA